MLKKGRLSKVEEKFIKDHTPGLHPQTIANNLNRSLDIVLSYITKHCPAGAAAAPVMQGPDPKALIRLELRNSMAWRHLLDEFDTDELKYFEEKYVAYKEQFQDDIKASEEGQLFKLIKFEILMHRNLVAQKQVRNEAERIERERTAILNKYKKTDVPEVDQGLLSTLETAARDAADTITSLTNQHEKLDKGHLSIMQALKATREQRIARATDSKKSLLDIIRVLSEQDQAEAADRMIDQMRRAADKELVRLGSVHQYADQTFDRPILNAQTVELEQ